MSQERHCGFVAILGAPNAGKSTLINRLVGAKVSIVSPKPQTTRHRILGIVVQDDTQYIFIDTPGIFTPRKRFDKAMVASAWAVLNDADAILLLIDASSGRIDERSRHLLNELRQSKKPTFVILNKTDLGKKEMLLALAAEIDSMSLAKKIFMISALHGDGIDDIVKELHPLMPKGPFHFPEDQLTDMPQRLLAAEIVREHLFRQLRQELPYELAVEPESWEQFKDGSIKISAKIILARTNLKAIILGAGGKQIKSVREAAQQELSSLLDAPVHLFLHVTVDEGWQDKRRYYAMWNLEFE